MATVWERERNEYRRIRLLGGGEISIKGRRRKGMALWELLKKGSEEGLETLKDGVTVFMSEAGRRGRILKKKVEMTSIQNDMRRSFIELGSLVYDSHARGDQDVCSQEDVGRVIRRIDEYKAKIRSIEAEIQEIKEKEDDEEKRRERFQGTAEEKESSAAPPLDRSA
jgi:hypothetical protein